LSGDSLISVLPTRDLSASKGSAGRFRATTLGRSEVRSDNVRTRHLYRARRRPRYLGEPWSSATDGRRLGGDHGLRPAPCRRGDRGEQFRRALPIAPDRPADERPPALLPPEVPHT